MFFQVMRTRAPSLEQLIFELPVRNTTRMSRGWWLTSAKTEGDDTALGQALFPVPAEDPNDPLQVCNPRVLTAEL